MASDFVETQSYTVTDKLWRDYARWINETEAYNVFVGSYLPGMIAQQLVIEGRAAGSFQVQSSNIQLEEIGDDFKILAIPVYITADEAYIKIRIKLPNVGPCPIAFVKNKI